MNEYEVTAGGKPVTVTAATADDALFVAATGAGGYIIGIYREFVDVCGRITVLACCELTGKFYQTYRNANGSQLEFDF